MLGKRRARSINPLHQGSRPRLKLPGAFKDCHACWHGDWVQLFGVSERVVRTVFCCDQPTTLHESRTDQAAKEGCGGGGRSIQALDWLSDFATLCAMVNALFAIQALSSS
jgi:hypothetical protein